MSDLKSLLEAEAELSAIFNRKKDPNLYYGSLGSGAN
jgi:hypothetical protein